MQNRQIYIADTNHGTILLSDCEKEVISTKLFNRLHHISQNSTAYLTFPTNRTKRFEHSIGTMKLCGDIFYNAICNTSDSLIEELFKNIKEIIHNIVDNEILKDDDKYRVIIGDSNLRNKGEKLKSLERYSLNNIFYNRFIPQNLQEEYKLLYTIVFQAIRLCGLLHDIGHPPFSHVTEYSINKIYRFLNDKEECSLTQREKQYVEIIKDYDSGDGNFQLHEKMGIKMTNKLFSQIIFSDNMKKLSFEEKWFKIVVFELVKLIFLEKEGLESLHNIISGTIDGDRLDYVNRDIENSGIDNGKIEYNRLIGSCKFCKVKIGDSEKVEVVYDSKTINTIEDFFMKRWYLYKNIISHHRVSKTDTILQNCVEIIIENYLSNQAPAVDTDNFILPDDISGLWLAIRFAHSNEEYFDSLIQWDDNWLITVLKKHYFRDYYKKTESVSYMLEEFLSNQKNYYSLIKNNNDFKFFSSAFEEEIEFDYIKNTPQYKKIEEKYSKNYKNRAMHIIFAYLDSTLDKKIDIKGVMDEFIKSEYRDEVEDYFVVFKKIKTWLDKDPIIYSFENEFILSELSNIRAILEVERSNYPYFYVYFKTKNEKILDNAFRKDFLEQFGRFLAEAVNRIIREELGGPKMENIGNKRPSFVVSEAILNQEGKFTVKDILDKVRNIIEDQFNTIDKLTRYIIEKLNSMCDYGLIGRTDVYYFSI